MTTRKRIGTVAVMVMHDEPKALTLKQYVGGLVRQEGMGTLVAIGRTIEIPVVAPMYWSRATEVEVRI
jgi:hypothetical protein